MNGNDTLDEQLKRISQKLASFEERLALLEGKPSSQKAPVLAEPIKPSVKPIVSEKKAPTYAVFDWHAFEKNVGNYLLQVLGVLLLIAGMVFFARYAIEQNLFTPFVQVILCLITATALFGVSVYARYTYALWSFASLIGSFMLYFGTVYLAYFHNFISVPTGLLFSTVISAAALGCAYYFNAQILAYITIFSVYALLRSFGEFSSFSALSTLLTTALTLFVSLKKRWRFLGFVALFLAMYGLERTTGIESIVYWSLLGLIYNILLIAFTAHKKNEEVFSEVLLLAISNLACGLFISIQALQELASKPVVSDLLSRDRLFTVLNFSLAAFFFFELIILLLIKKWPLALLSMVLALSLVFAAEPLLTHYYFLPIGSFIVLLLPLFYITNHPKRILTILGVLGLFEIHTLFYKTGPTGYDFFRNGSSAVLMMIILFITSLFARHGTSPLHDKPGEHEACSEIGCPDFSLSKVLHAGIASVPLLLFFSFHQNRVFSPYEALLTAAYGAGIMMQALMRKQLLQVWVGYAGIIASCIFALHYYLPIDVAETTLTKSIFGVHYPLGIFGYTVLLGGLSLIFFVLFLMLKILKPSSEQRYYSLQNSIGYFALLFAFLLGRIVILYGAYYYAVAHEIRTSFQSFARYLLTRRTSDIPDFSKAKNITEHALTMYYGITGFILIIGGLAFKKPVIRFSGLVLFFITLWKLLLIVSGFSNSLLRIGAFIFIGFILIISSYFYQKLLKKSV